jgi:hypothetical protein
MRTSDNRGDRVAALNQTGKRLTANHVGPATPVRIATAGGGDAFDELNSGIDEETDDLGQWICTGRHRGVEMSRRVS